MPIELVIRNIKRSIRDYRIYFYTLIIFVVIFLVFNSFDESVSTLNLNITQVNIFVSLIFAFLLLYANLFMIRQRRAEFMTLALLGMSLRRIIFTICIETCVVIILSLFVGIPSGLLFSQIVNLFVRYFLYGSAAGYCFKISCNAILNISMIYLILIFFVCLFNTLFVGRIKLYLLLKEDYVGSKRMPQTGYKEPTILLAISLLIIVINRFLLVDILSRISPIAVVIAFFTAIISMFLMIRAAFLYLGAFAASDKGLKYAFEVRFITDSGHELTYFMTAVSVIILMSFVLIAGSFGIINNMRKLSMVNVPYDVMMLSIGDSDIDDELNTAGIDTGRYFSSYVQPVIYNVNSLKYSTFCDEDSYIYDEYIFFDPDTPVNIMSESRYNEIADMSGMDPIDLGDDQYVLTSDIASIQSEFSSFLSGDNTININGFKLNAKNTECTDLSLFLGLSKSNPGLVIVPDHVVRGAVIIRTYLMGYLKDPAKEVELLTLVSEKTSIAEGNVTTSTMLSKEYRDMTFDILYLSFYTSCVFVICSIAVLSFKEMITIGSRSSMLKSLMLMGFPDEEIRRYFICHITTIYSIPAIATFLHSGYMIRAINRFVEMVGQFDISSSYMVFSLFLFPIMTAFSMLTYKTSSDLCFRVRSRSYGKY